MYLSVFLYSSCSSVEKGSVCFSISKCFFCSLLIIHEALMILSVYISLMPFCFLMCFVMWFYSMGFHSAKLFFVNRTEVCLLFCYIFCLHYYIWVCAVVLRHWLWFNLFFLWCFWIWYSKVTLKRQMQRWSVISLLQSAADTQKSDKMYPSCTLQQYFMNLCNQFVKNNFSPPTQSISVSTQDILNRLFQSCLMHLFPSL